MTARQPWTFAVLLTLAACSSEPSADRGTAAGAPVAADAEPPETPQAKRPAPAAAATMLTLEGLGPLRIGQPVPAASGWAERGAQISDECRTVGAPAFPGVYAIVEQGKVGRITLGRNSAVMLAEGIGLGAPEAEVRAAFPGFHAEPHKYSDPPARYLTAPDAERGGPALRFEIGPDGRVALIHAGTMPVLGYVEGCA